MKDIDSPSNQKNEEGVFPHFSKENISESPLDRFLKIAVIAGFLILIFFLIYWVFGRLAGEEIARSDVFSKLRDGRVEVKRMAARYWIQKLEEQEVWLSENSGELDFDKDWRPNEIEEKMILAEFRGRVGQEAAQNRESDQFLSSLVAIMGHFSERHSLQAESMIEAQLVAGMESNSSAGWTVYGIISYARLLSKNKHWDSDTALSLAKLLAQSSNVSVRKTLAFSLGLSADSQGGEFNEILSHLLDDSEESVRWNSSFSLARLGDLRAKDQLLKLFQDMDALKSDSGVTELRMRVYQESIRAALKLGDPFLLEKARIIAQKHPHIKLRLIAKEILKSN